jgi:hypothetical protein
MRPNYSYVLYLGRPYLPTMKFNRKLLPRPCPLSNADKNFQANSRHLFVIKCNKARSSINRLVIPVES